MKTILFIDNAAWSLYNFRQPLVRQLRADGHKVIVASAGDEYVERLDKTCFHRYIQLKHLDRQGKNPFKDILLMAELFRIYKSTRPDIVINFTMKPSVYGSLLARWLGIPAISVLTGLGHMFVKQGIAHRLLRRLMKHAFGKLQRLVVYNADDVNTLAKSGIIQAARCVVIQGEGLNTDHFGPQPMVRNDGKFVFLFVGRLLNDKGIADFAEAARQLKALKPNAECWISGDLRFSNPSAINKEDLQKWVELGYVKYMGFTMDIRKVISQCDVLVLPSRGGEGMPRPILEAMAMRKPVITTITSGCRSVVAQGENGLVVPPADPVAVLDAMLRMSGLPKRELELMGDKNRAKVVKHYDAKVVTRLFTKEIYTVLDCPLPELAAPRSPGHPSPAFEAQSK